MVVVVGPDAVRRCVQNLALEDAEAELKNKVQLTGPDDGSVALVEAFEIKLDPGGLTFEAVRGRHLSGTVNVPECAGAAQEIAVVQSP
jgi:hypothetical protein